MIQNHSRRFTEPARYTLTSLALIKGQLITMLGGHEARGTRIIDTSRDAEGWEQQWGWTVWYIATILWPRIHRRREKNSINKLLRFRQHCFFFLQREKLNEVAVFSTYILLLLSRYSLYKSMNMEYWNLNKFKRICKLPYCNNYY